MPDDLLPKLARQTANTLAAKAGKDQRWHGRRVLAADGSAFSMPDTPRNQARFPQPSSQKAGCGFPVGVFVAVVCLVTGAVIDAFIGAGKMHDLAMFRCLRDCFAPGDIFLADRGFSAYAEMALFKARGVDSVVRLHQRRLTDFRRGRVLGIVDHVVRWPCPKSCPKGLRPDEFARLPAWLAVRELRYRIEAKGFRTKEVVLATLLLDAAEYPASDLANLYFHRWDIEVDFRHLKITLQMDVLRGQSPGVVEKEFWAHVLAYNLLRHVMWESGKLFGAKAIRLSPKGSLQHLLTVWTGRRFRRFSRAYLRLCARIVVEVIPDRPGRVEPRVRKRRPKNYSLMTRPRSELKKRLPLDHY